MYILFKQNAEVHFVCVVNDVFVCKVSCNCEWEWYKSYVRCASDF